MMKKTCMIMMIITFSFTIYCHAIKVSNLYQAEISVASQARDAREQAVKDGFLQVLIKLSGDTHIDQNKVIQTNLKRADYYVSDFNYLSATKDSSQYSLQINYEPSDINRLLKQANLSHWNENRPLILVWLVVENSMKNQREIIGNEVAGEVYTLMLNESKKYGLPLIFPMMDVTEIDQISPDDITYLSMDVLAKNSQRYLPEALLIGDIYEQEGEIKSQWQLVTKSKKWNWIMSERSVDVIIANLIQQIRQVVAMKDHA